VRGYRRAEIEKAWPPAKVSRNNRTALGETKRRKERPPLQLAPAAAHAHRAAGAHSDTHISISRGHHATHPSPPIEAKAAAAAMLRGWRRRGRAEARDTRVEGHLKIAD